MSIVQKIIKYLAIAFAIFLIITMISVALGIISGLSGVLNLNKERKHDISINNQISFENDDISFLDINMVSCNLTIKKGTSLKVETNNKYVSCTQEENNKLKIEEKQHLHWNNNSKQVTIYIPENIQFDIVNIGNGAGKIILEDINTKVLSLDLGPGETLIKNIVCTEKSEIEGGAGKFIVESGNINNLNFDLGVGEVVLTSRLLGKSVINSGVGSLSLNLTGNKDEYMLKTQKGIGSIRIDGKEISSDNEEIGSGMSKVDIDGGIGSINVNFK